MTLETMSVEVLTDGRTLTVKVATPPLSKSLVDNMSIHSISKTDPDSRARLFGAFRGNSLDYFFLGELGGELVGTVWYCTPATCQEIAYLGEVFTAKEQRNKGIATCLVDVSINHFRENGGRAIYVTNLCPNAPNNILRQKGFQAYGYGQHAYGGIIRYIVDEREDEFDQNYYRPDPKTSIREVNQGDLPNFIALFNYPHPWIARAYTLDLIGNKVFDENGRSFMNLLKTLKHGNECLVLEDSKHRVVGTAWSSSLPTKSQSHVKRVDFTIHPNYFNKANILLEALIKRISGKTEKVQAYVANTDTSKIDILTSCHFKKEAILRNQIHILSKKIDLEIYSR